MLLQSHWLPSLFSLASAAAHAYPAAAALNPRTASYPTGPANGTAISTGSFPTSTATPSPIPPNESFYLIVAKTGTAYDGDYLTIGSETTRNGLLVLYPGALPDQITRYSTFTLNADGTLRSDFSGGTAAVFNGGTYGTIIFQYDEEDITESVCEGTLGEAFTCQTGADTVFFICPFQNILGTIIGGTVDVGPMTRPGCTPISLLAVPV